VKRHNGHYPAPLVPIPGWMSGKELEWLYTKAREHQVIVEVGSAYGRSSHAILCGNYESFGKEGVVYCVDPWPKKIKGIDEFVTGTKDMRRRSEFWKNCGGFPNLNVIELPSMQASWALAQAGVTMVFLDGGINQLDKDYNYWRMIRPKLLCGHDYGEWKTNHFLHRVEDTLLWEVG